MKKTLVMLFALCTLVTVCLFSFASCDEEDEKKKTDTGDDTTVTEARQTTHQHLWGDWVTVTPASCTNGSQERTCACGEKEIQTLDAEHHYDETGKCTACGIQPSYSLTYVSNGDGTCYVSAITTYPDYGQDFVLEIPDVSPDGDRVTAVRCGDFAKPIPWILAVEDYEKILATMNEKVESGELDLFYFKKFQTYFERKSLSDRSTDTAKENLLTAYPICAVTDVYVLCSGNSANEDRWLLSYLREYAEFTENDLCEVYQNLRAKVNESKVENKEEILSRISLPTAFAEHVISIRVPAELEEIDISLYRSCYNLKKLTVPKCITEIPAWAFSESLTLTEVTLLGCATIGEGAFFECVNLAKVSLLGNADFTTFLGDQCFYHCTALTEIVIPSYIHQIGASAFENSGLKNVTIECDNITSVGSNAFKGCESLIYNTKDHINYLGNKESPYLVAIEPTAKNITEITLDENCIFIADSAFAQCSELINVTLSKNLKRIGAYAFSYCQRLTRIDMDDTQLISIDRSAFENCSELKNVTLPNSLLGINPNAFAGCYALEEFVIPKKLSFIGNRTFLGCNNLTITVDEENPFFDIQNGVLYRKRPYDQKIELVYVSPLVKGIFTVPDDVSCISSYAFYNCEKITDIVIPSSVTEIGYAAFEACYQLKTVKIPTEVTVISKNAFSDCENLTQIIFGGTREAWNELTKNNGWDSNTGDYTVICEDGEIKASDSTEEPSENQE